jgi:DinB superfamily
MATDAQIRELVEKMAHERDLLTRQVLQLGERDAERVPVGKGGEDQWTVKEQLAHLGGMERAYRLWVESACAQDNPNVTLITAPAAAISVEDANLHTVSELVGLLAAERQTTSALIGSMRPSDFDRVATHAMFGTLSVLQWLRSYYRHDRMHGDQIAGRTSMYQPAYANGVEPNQRTANAAQRQAVARQPETSATEPPAE